MKPRMRAYSKAYWYWMFTNTKHYTFNADVMMPTTTDPNTGITKYIKAP